MEVVLRELRESDVPALRLLVEDADTRLWNPIDDPDLEAWIQRQNVPDDTAAVWAVAAPDDDRFLGTALISSIDTAQGTGEVGYRVAPSERGRGVATAALVEATRRAFEVHGLRRVELFHAVDNPASCTVAERAGFRCEGTLRQSYVYGDGRAHDEHLHARLVTDPATA